MRKILFSAFLMLFFLPLFSQTPGSPDVTYGTGGSSADAPKQMNTKKMVVQADGKIVIIGTVDDPETYLLAAIARYTATGSIDKTFSNDGIVTVPDVNAGIFDFDVAVQKDGKILIAGIKGAAGDEETPNEIVVYRYNTDGTRDNTFEISEVYSPQTGAGPEMIVESDGDIVVASISPFGANVFVYSSNGTKQSEQDFSAIEESDIFISPYPDGGGFVASYVTSETTKTVYSSRFGLKGFEGAGRSGHALLNDNKVVVLINNNNGQVMRLNANGSIDAGFGMNGYAAITGFTPAAIASQPNGKLIVQGWKTGTGYGFMRLNANGTIDSNFGNNGFVASDFTNDLAVYGNRLFALGTGDIGDNRSGERVVAYLLSTDPRMIKVNLYGNTDPYVNSEWNNWNNIKNRHFDNFYYSDSTYSPIDAVMSNRNGVNDNGANYGGSNTLMAPKGVLRHSSYSIGARTVTLSGLMANKKYDLEFYSSRNDHSGNSTVFAINGVAKTVSTYRNFTRKVIFENLMPNAQGQIVINLKSTRDYNYLNGFVLTEKFNTTTAATTAVQENNTELMVVEKEKVTTEDVTVFPNPTANYFTLKLQNKNSQPVQLTISDATGRIVEARTTAANTILTLGHNYKPGIYYVQVRNGLTQQILKLIKK